MLDVIVRGFILYLFCKAFMIIFDNDILIVGILTLSVAVICAVIENKVRIKHEDSIAK